MKSWMVDSILESEETARRRQIRQTNRKKKLAIDAIKLNIVVGDAKKAIDIAVANGIDSEEFGKIVKSLN